MNAMVSMALFVELVYKPDQDGVRHKVLILFKGQPDADPQELC